MKTTLKFFGTQSGILSAIAFVVVIALSMAACDSDFGGGGGTDPLLNGTWVYEVSGLIGSDFKQITVEFYVTFNNGSFERYEYASDRFKGTYTTNDNKITMTTTHIFDGDWYSRAEWKKTHPDYELDEIFNTRTERYSISGNTLVLGDGPLNTYTKK